jgi:hypothetical protein
MLINMVWSHGLSIVQLCMFGIGEMWNAVLCLQALWRSGRNLKRPIW